MSLKNMHYRFPGGVTGDTMPFYHGGKYHMFTLDSEDGSKVKRNGNSWSHLVSDDYVHWEFVSKVIEKTDTPGTPDEDGTWTGSVVEKDGVFHMFYTGFSKVSETHQTICHATSPDLLNWERDSRNPLLCGDGIHFEKTDFRDPDVFYNEDDGCWWMLICARKTYGPSFKRGAIALAKSDDLYNWTLQDEPLYAPGVAHCMECPHMFKLGNKWYIFFSRYCNEQKTQYRMSDSMYGPWEIPYPDAVNTRDYYAVKSLFDGKRRLGLAWIFDRLNESDNGTFEWGGELGIPYEFVQQPDGRLAFKALPAAVEAYRDEKLPYQLKDGEYGGFTEKDGVIAGESDGFIYASLAHEEGPMLIEADLELDSLVEECGILFKCSDDLNQGYRLGIRPKDDTAVIAVWPERMDSEWMYMTTHFITNPVPIPELSTHGYPPVRAQMGLCGSKRINIKLFLTGSMVEACVNDKVALSFRIYDKHDGMIGIFTQGGKTVFKQIRMDRPIG